MFKLNEKYEIIRNSVKCDYIRYSPSEISTINSANSQIYIIIAREDGVVSLLNSYLELNFDVLHAANINRYADNKDIKLVNLGPISLLSKYKVATSSVEYLKNIEHGHIACLMYKFFTTARRCDELCIGFDRCRDGRQRELTNNRNIKGKYLFRFYLKDVFGFAQHQFKGTYGLGYILTPLRNIDSAVLNKDNPIDKAKIEINSIHWY